ncbi:hypothetical protein A2757_02440 [Candidatus Giovannonibacteria bacterium RIFCSPHIGHO2_01_FULL_48_47]|nr:MAG: hypothetical protein A2757_02440 [Candidatus Giovannonibacteria bacterium RIFCSPHIGHO2_01_FULL_48_47]OGF68607.1 MAG: hypothetical protein A3D61_01720 [Candidatus Giovannonibacteria bacterium RIFCSPHIGHO2_02_FULL_48_15]OGF88506.1 MAG: hypothetical protein A3B26_02150 [Candidatus Giovannonibacteria bacterium RIFCSPLOWO2_01_FULL_48_47]OGF95451.1 MAG: hypothetical protein A2433_00315 [Candidatus Giovannonibacteria bacterium RIFOXYC1_FULL_48_8]OGF96465.1 MAG: hypothetical protein A2613_02835
MAEFLVLMSWEAPEHELREKTPDWYWAVGIIAFGFLILAILLKNFLFAILVLLGGFTVAMYGVKQPKIVNFAITSRGIKVEDKLYPYDNLQFFWINYDPPHVRELYLISKKTFQPQISIPLGQADPNEVREHLIKFLEEKEIEESLFDTIARFFRF